MLPSLLILMLPSGDIQKTRLTPRIGSTRSIPLSTEISLDIPDNPPSARTQPHLPAIDLISYSDPAFSKLFRPPADLFTSKPGRLYVCLIIDLFQPVFTGIS